VRDRIVAETRGNPLALLELPRGLSAAELAGGFGLPDAPTLASRIERSFLRRLGSFPVKTQRLLLAAAAEPTGEVTLLWRAAGRLGVGAAAWAPAEAAGLIELGARVRFRHPLLRAAVYRAAALPDRRAVHRPLAAATDPGADPDRRAWHHAHAATGPDEAVAGELERSAARAQGRGGVAAAAAFLKRSAELTPDPARRGARALAAARAKFAAGAPDAAYELIAMAELGWLDELQRAELARLRAQMAFAERRGSHAPRLLLDAAEMLEPLDSGLARETYLEALEAAIFAGRLGHGLIVREAAEAARTAAPPAPGPPRPMDLLLDGNATRLTEGYVAGVPPLRRTLDALRRDGGRSEDDIVGWLWLACRVASEPIAPELWDDAIWHELIARAVGLAREAGALAVLPVALTYRAAVHVHAGEFGAAAGLIEEADAITAATGNAPLGYTSLMLAAWRSEETRALELTEAAVQDATARSEGKGRSGSPGMPLRCCTTVWAATRPPWPAPGGHARTRTWVSSDGPWPSSSRREPAAAPATTGRRPCGSSASGPAPPGRSGHSASRPGHARCSATARLRTPCTGRRSTVSGAAASRSISPAPTWCTANGCAASSGERKRASTCGLPTICSPGSGPRRSPNGPGGSSRRQARQCASAPWTRATPLPRRRRRSPGSLPRATRTLRSAPSCSSAPGPRSTTCTRCSPSSASTPAGSSGTTWRWPHPDGAPPEGITGDGELRPGIRAGNFDRCERPWAGGTLRGNPS
jgi:hypothetical protein